MEALNTTDHVDFSRRYTLEEFWALPEPEDRAHYELIGVYLFMVPPPNPPHGKLDSRLNQSLIIFLHTNNIVGEVHHPKEPIYRRSEGSTYIEPDMTYVSRELSKQVGDTRTSADIVFEYLSRSTAVYDRTRKADAYLLLGVRELWLVDAVTETVEVRHSSKSDETSVWETCIYSRGRHAKSRVLAGWEVSVDELFKDLR